MSENSNQQLECAKSCSNSDLDAAIQELIDRFTGRTRVTTRDPSGKRRILAVTFGPRTNPSHFMEVEDFGNPENPTSRESRLYDLRVKRHEARRLEIEQAVDNALKLQRERLTGESEVKAPSVPVPSFDQESWSKTDFAKALGALLSADDCPLSNDGVRVNTSKGKNEVFVTSGGREIKINISFPRAKKA